MDNVYFRFFLEIVKIFMSDIIKTTVETEFFRTKEPVSVFDAAARIVFLNKRRTVVRRTFKIAASIHKYM